MVAITSKLLRSKGACAPQVALFKKLGGDELELTEALFASHAAEFSWTWAADNLLEPQAKELFNHFTSPVLAIYERAVAAALTKFQNTRDASWPECSRVLHVAAAECAQGVARAFYRAWASEQDTKGEGQ